ncbi:MAG: fibronectin type III domain-containing protein [Patescibacteria group bacterium]
MKNNFTKILFVIFTAIGILGFFGQVKAAPDPLVVGFETTPLFSETNFLPGGGITRWVKVANNSGTTQRIATQPLNITDPNHLGDVLNLVIKEGGTTLYNNALSNFLANGEVYLSNLANGTNTQYDFNVSFYSGTQNTFQGKSLGFDILIGFQGTEGGILPGAGSTSGYGGGGGGGGGLPPGLTIQNEATAITTETSVTFTWATSYPASSQVIYALGSESHTLDLTDTAGTPPKYGYAHTTPESDVSPKVVNHSVIISGLTPATIYYYRTVSHASLAISAEHSFTTLKENVLSGAPSVSVAITPPSASVLEEEPAVTPEQPTTEQPAEQPITQAPQSSLLAAMGVVLTLGTGSVWLGILAGLIILAIIVYAVYLLRKRKNSGNI